jgi:uncharacterized protein (UPF0332 family)
VRAVAVHLSNPDSKCEQSTWDAIEDARCRSSRSRAYYAAFLAIKTRVLAHRPGFPFPDLAAHSVIISSIGHVFGDTARITLVLKGLLEQRKRADYEIEGPGDPKSGLASLLENSRFAIEAVDSWHAQQVEQLIAAISRYRK